MHIGVIGAGLVGTGWSIVFARGGEHVRVFDASQAARDRVLDAVAGRLADLKEVGLVDNADEIMARVEVCDDMAAVIEGAKYAPVVFDNGKDLVVIQASDDFPQEAINPTLQQVAGNLKGSGRFPSALGF